MAARRPLFVHCERKSGRAERRCCLGPPRWHKVRLRSGAALRQKLRKSKCLQLTSVLTVLPTETKETKRKLQNLLTPTSRSQLSAVRVSFGSSAPLLSPPPILTHTGVFWRTPTRPKKEYTSIISTK